MDDNFTIPESSPAAAPALNRRGFWGVVGFFLHALAAGSFFSCRRPEPEMKPIEAVPPIVTVYYPATRYAPIVGEIRNYDPTKFQCLMHCGGEWVAVDVEFCE